MSGPIQLLSIAAMHCILEVAEFLNLSLAFAGIVDVVADIIAWIQECCQLRLC